MFHKFHKGDRVQVVGHSEGFGVLPVIGALGTVDVQQENGNVVVKLDDGRRALLASWEITPAGGKGQL